MNVLRGSIRLIITAIIGIFFRLLHCWDLAGTDCPSDQWTSGRKNNKHSMESYRFHMAAHEGNYELLKDAVNNDPSLVTKKDDVS